MNQEREIFAKYFEDIKKIWSKLNNPNRIIPFCTPLIMRPDFLIIGKNHSDNFDPHNENKNNQIADAFSKEIAKENTFLEHSHPFAKGVERVVRSINHNYENFLITEKWIGTNRCAIQTNSGGLGTQITHHKNYEECQKEMDKLLKRFINFIKPKNVILTGLYACHLYFPRKKLEDMSSKKVLLGKDSNETFNLIPVEHFSMNYNTQKIIKRISNALDKGYCEI